jgi:hypothetical protein
MVAMCLPLWILELNGSSLYEEYCSTTLLNPQLAASKASASARLHSNG